MVDGAALDTVGVSALVTGVSALVAVVLVGVVMVTLAPGVGGTVGISVASMLGAAARGFGDATFAGAHDSSGAEDVGGDDVGGEDVGGEDVSTLVVTSA